MIEYVVYSALKDLVGGRCYPLTFEQPKGKALPTWPAIRYVVLSSDSAPDICGTDDVTSDDVLVQIDLVASSYSEVLALQAQAIDALQAASEPNTRERTSQEYDVETKTYRVSMDYLFMQSTPGGSP